MNVVPLREWLLPECKFVVGLENEVHFCQWVFAAEPKSPFLARVLQEVYDRYSNSGGINTSNPHFVHYHTGPAVFSMGLKKAFSELFGMSEGLSWDARQWYDFFQQRKKYEASLNGICLFDSDSFNKRYVQNLYASQMKIRGYNSWTDLAANMHVAEKKTDSLSSAQPGDRLSTAILLGR